MNTRYTFEVLAYNSEENGKYGEVFQASTTGSQETRARRRLLEALHDRGLFARRVTLVGSEAEREAE